MSQSIYNPHDLARELVAEYSADWNSDAADAEQVARSRYAVVISRREDAWVECAETAQEIAEIALSLNTDGDSLEWIEDIYDMQTGDQLVNYSYRRTYAITLPSGESGTATFPKED